MRVSVMDIAVLMYHVQKGASHPQVGHLDTERTLAKLRAELNKSITLDMSAVESAVHSCTLLRELEEFQHPDGITLDQMINRITTPGWKFNPLYGVFEYKKDGK